MKAVVIREFGPPEVMRLEEVPDPEPAPDEVVIRVEAVSVNRTLDLVLRAGNYAIKPTLPHVLGVDPVGTVVKLGRDVTDRTVGERVAYGNWGRETTAQASQARRLGVHVWGGYAEMAAIPATALVPIPAGLDIFEAAVIARHAPLAMAQLTDKAKAQAGDWVLVMGSAGGLGSMAVQVAKTMGCKVIGAAGTDDRAHLATELGADASVNYRAADLTEEVKRITDGRGVDVVLENIGDPELFPKAFASLATGGRLVTAGGHGGGTVPLDVNRLYLGRITVIGSPAVSEADYHRAMDLAVAGKLHAVIDRVMPLAAAVDAHHLVAGRQVTGKVLLDPARTA